MSNAHRGDVKPEALGEVVEYRDLLRAELAKIEGHLAIAERLATSERRRELECWLTSDVEAPERLH